LECVDYVTWFAEETPLKLIEKIKPDLLVKGGDWKAHQIVGSEFVRSYGGKVKSLPFIRGHSTTDIIKRANLASLSGATLPP
jgi:bifunctional ADP-heptose synthase (sugar kinase/adenylyltransferase)